MQPFSEQLPTYKRLPTEKSRKEVGDLSLKGRAG
jgi:hypothetical protein